MTDTELRERLHRVGYIADEALATTLWLAGELQRPLLLEGDAGVGKTAREIALAFGVPPLVLGIPGDATYANYQEANRAFYRLTVLPLATRVAQALSDWLSDFAGEAATLAPDLDAIPALSAERDAQWRRVAEAGFLTDAEKRALLGLPPLEASDGR